MRPRLAAIALLLLGLVLLAGCGGGGGKSGMPGGASVVPKSTVAFISLVTDRSSPQWTQALDLIKRFPGAGKALAQPMGKGVLSAIGPEVDIAVLDLPSSGPSDAVLLTQPKDAAKLNSSVSSGTVHTVVDGWTVYANSQATLKKFEAERSGGTLNDEKAFQDAYGGLPSDALAKAYINGSVIEQRLQKSLAQSNLSLSTTVSSQSGKLESLSAALVPEQAGVKLHLNANGNLPGSPSTFSPELPSQLPSGALVYVSFSDLESSLRTALSRAAQLYPQLDATRAQLETLGGFSVDKDLLPLFAGEGGVAVYPGLKQPTLDVVFKISDPAEAKKVLSGITKLARLAKSVKVTSVKGVTQFQTKTATISVALLNDLLVVTNQAASLAQIQGATVTLADDPVYLQAVKDSSLPSKTSGFVYVNTPLALKYELTSMAKQSKQRVNPQVLAAITHLQGALLYANKNGGNYELTGFLGIK